MPSYEESVNMSRCNLATIKLLLKSDEVPSRPQVHEFLVEEFAETSIQQYNVMELSCNRPSSIKESVIHVATFRYK